MERLGPVIATAALPHAAGQIRASREARRVGADRVEVRIDLLKGAEDPLALLGLANEMPLLVSGNRKAADPSEIPVLKAAQEAGAYVDLSWADDMPADLWGLDRTRLVLSFHDFEGMPADLPGILGRMRRVPAAHYKIVPTAGDASDMLAIKDLLSRNSGIGLAAFAMGAAGAASRVLAPSWGSAATYAAAPGCGAAAPGQIPLDALLDLYRIREIRPNTPLYAVAGWPLRWTGSPLLHNRWLAERGLDGCFLPLPARDWNSVERLLEDLPLEGLAVTIPHKEAAVRFARPGRLAEKIGAANTLFRRKRTWRSANTDAYGVRHALRGMAKGTRSLLLGAGGAAAAVAEVLRGLGPAQCASRDRGRAESLAARFGLGAVPWQERREASWNLLVNATPVGQKGDGFPVDAGSLRGFAVFDLVVRSGGTPLLREAAERGLSTIPGEVMLEAQARMQFRLFTGISAPGGSLDIFAPLP